MTEATPLTALWPAGLPAVPIVAPAPRLSELTGQTIAFLWDNVFRGDEIFATVEGALSEAYEGIRFVPFDTFGSTFGGDEHEVLAALPERLRAEGVDAVISGVGC